MGALEVVYFSVEKVLGGFIVNSTALNAGQHQVVSSLSKVMKLAKEALADAAATVVPVTE